MIYYLRLYWGLLAIPLFLLAACASGPSKDAAPTATPAAAPSRAASPQPAPAWASLPQNPPGDAARVCLWVFWTDNQTLMREMRAMLGQGKPFQSAALDMARNNKGYVTTHADCLAKSELPAAMTKAIKGLRLGQVSGVFALNGGQALAMLTSDVFRRQAQKLYQQGKYREAMQPLSLDLELHPAAAGSWHLMALCRAATGDKQGALKAYDQALEWTPNDPAVLNDKATLFSTMGQGGQAVVLFRRALAAAPDNPVYMNNLAWALVKNKHDLNEALTLAQKAARLAPDNPAVWDTLGLVQQARGDHAGAVMSFHHALRLDPQAAGAKSRMTASLLKLSPDQVTRLGVNGVKLPPAPAPRPKPALKPRPKSAPKPEPVPAPQAAPAPEPKSGPAPAPAPEAKPAPQPKAMASTGWSQRPAPETKPAPAARPQPSPIAEAKPAPAPAPKPAPVAKAKAKPAPASPPKAEPKPAPPAAQQAGKPPRGWYLQLSSNRNPNLARAARNRWVAAGQPAQVWDWNSPKSGLWHRVLLGPFPGKAQALAAGRRFKDAGKLPGYVLVRVR
ncbi:MAG: SPOR domain-containing protein [Proteobacteria bacterium]|nr:SPOR domain-containing protein [Pseudomonadota bacterium]MBU1451819.1 SPOR domain-containing protein [Pseudomonadota bacterium]MBU2470700.1 SPOR domain-containing protein [Pseudomonadota bacterium]MBU2516531.1 SPOR domain-containing protein [Pseudomonadota bacterium]